LAMALTTTLASGAMIQQFNLNDLANRAGSIFRGTVLDTHAGSIDVGGGDIPTISYRIRVTEFIKGASAGDSETVTLRMYGELKPRTAADGVQYLGGLQPDLLEVGGDYLLFVTSPSRVGLSAPVGLSQGTFKILTREKETVAVNGLNNEGLLSGMKRAGLPDSGPIQYGDLKARIREEMGKGQQAKGGNGND
jgi:hypothetical protein